MNYTEVEVIKIFLVSILLIYACYYDVKSRIVPNRVWKLMLIINLPFLLYQIFTIFTENPISLIFPAIGIPFMISLSYLLYIIKAFGGADAKALMCLAIVFPFYPEISPFLFNRGIGIFSFSVLTNSVIFAPFLMLAM
ncbi:MAG: A24 family peptidase, partial [Archaeoglobaceae archaeon]